MSKRRVVPDDRGNWRIFEDARPEPLSDHNTATDAESSAWAYAKRRGGQEIVVHDRYGRTRPPVPLAGAGTRRAGVATPAECDVPVGLA
jgi:hypothetical protein